MNPYYTDDRVTLWHGDCRDILGDVTVTADVLVTDPPYGIAYQSGWHANHMARGIAGDHDTSLRDHILDWWGDRPALIFGTWRIPRPAGTRTRLIWDTKGALGMGALDLPWKPSSQEVYVLGMNPPADGPSEEIYVLGKGFTGRRDSDVITCAPVQSLGYNGRRHPHEKPVALMARLIDKCPPGTILDPCAGVGPTVIAARDAGRPVIACEINESYCETIVRRLAADSLFSGVTA